MTDVYEDLFERLQQEEDQSPTLTIDNTSLQQEVAEWIDGALQACNGDNPKEIERICYYVTGFIRFDFNSELDDIIDLASMLEIPGDPEVVIRDFKILQHKSSKYVESLRS